MRRRLGSVRVRTTLAATLLTALVLIAGSVAIIRVVEDDLLEAAGDPFHEALEEAGFEEGVGEARVVAVDTAAGPVVLVLSRSTTAGAVDAVVIDEDSEARGSFTFDPADGAIGEAAMSDRLRDALEPAVLAGLSVDGDGDGAARELLADAALGEVREGVDAVRNALLLVVPALIVILGLSTWFVVGRALRPVHAISAQVATIRTSTLDERVPVPDADDEIAELALLMNGMLDRLEEGSERQRRFVSDASHELRSPLSTIMAAAEVAQASDDPTRLRGLADELVAEAQRMDRLIDDLLDLARFEEDSSAPTTETVELRALVEAALAEVAADDVDVSVDVPAGLAVEGSRAALERAAANLVRNAVQHARGHITVAADVDGGAVRLTVDDDGPGVPASERERIFERFVRLDASRQRGTGGAGIGLSMVRAIAERSGGSVTATDAPELGGARFVLALPAASAEPDAAGGRAEL